jgi:hypothetical protein
MQDVSDALRHSAKELSRLNGQLETISPTVMVFGKQIFQFLADRQHYPLWLFLHKLKVVTDLGKRMSVFIHLRQTLLLSQRFRPSPETHVGIGLRRTKQSARMPLTN